MSNIIDLYFTGPYNVNDYYNIDLENEKVIIKAELPLNGVEKKRPGFYIWGFNGHSGFIPYYVGKIESCILSRLRQHIYDIIKWDSSSVRLSTEYLFGNGGFVPFYIDELFMPDEKWIYSDLLPSWLKDNQTYFQDKIIYCNNKKFLETFCNISEPHKDRYSRGYPISNLKINREREDSLYSNVHNMYFVCTEYSTPVTCSERSDIYETIESYIKYSLKGKTVCDVLNYSTMLSRVKGKYDMKIRLECVDSIKNIFKDRADHSYYPGYDF